MSDFVMVVALAVIYSAGYLTGRAQRGCTAVFLLALPRCREEAEELDAALDGLAKRGAITPEQAEAAKRRIAEGGEA